MDAAPKTRVDMSGVALWKRLLLMALAFLCASCITLAVMMQFYGIKGFVQISRFMMTVEGGRNFLEVGIGTRVVTRWSVRLEVVKSEWYEFADWFPFPVSYRTFPLPGVRVNNNFVSAIQVRIHHAWLIGTSAALYLFARWRIRRTARLKAGPANVTAGNDRTESDGPN